MNNYQTQEPLTMDVIFTENNNYENSLDQLYKKQTGSYYTDLNMTDAMVTDVVNKVLLDRKKIWKMKFLEPCVGTGNFVFSYLRIVKSLDLSIDQYTELINNIYVCDINKDALELYKKNFSLFVFQTFGIIISPNYYETHISNGLLFDVTNISSDYISIENAFPHLKEKSFDIIITNPPYKNLKAERSFYENESDFNSDKLIYSKISIISKQIFSYCTEGIANLFKYFVEEITDKYANNDAYVNVLIPSSILSDKSCSKLRTHLLKDCCIQSIKVLPETCPYVNAQQALCAIFYKTNGKTNDFIIFKDYYNEEYQFTTFHINDALNEKTGNAIFAISNQENLIIKQLHRFKTVKDLPFIHNYRGELDLTINKKSICNEKTEYQLLRGRNIAYYELIETDNKEYVYPSFVEACSKIDFVKKDRIICQQVVNMKKERRVSFVYIPKDYVLGNSCNFISVDNNKYGIDLYTLLGLFNSKLINWYFKLTSSNNHINNYEIDNFPVPIDSAELSEISKLAKEFLITKNPLILNEIDRLVYRAFNIEDFNMSKSKNINNTLIEKLIDDIRKILPKVDETIASELIDGKLTIDSLVIQIGAVLDKIEVESAKSIVKKYQKISKNEILNHTTFKMSDLDMEMITAVPQGGNWKSIPSSTVSKSKRLQRITQTGGRTTLYGRLDYSKPSYTITTYFNRPGNGTYIHPIHDRVLSVREAARFQCFKDDYYFYGNKTQLLKQIGNAVPSLFAYLLGERIVSLTNCKNSIDLFCGAGGLTYGFKEAGIKSLIANDIEESACITLKTNNPEIEVLCGDITQEKTKDYIVNKSIDKGIDIICGGPPCQGFSMAGFRLNDDPRNQLFKDFLNIVERIKPKVVVFENVEGLLSFQNGQVYKTIINHFNDIGYNTFGKTIMTNEYAIPQKRKRVIIICTRNDLSINPELLFPRAITESTDTQVTCFEAISDLEKIECSDEAHYTIEKESSYVRMLKGKMSYKQYAELFSHNDSSLTFNDDQLTLAI